MAGALVKIDEEIVSSAVSSVSLTGIDSTYNVFKVVISNVNPSVDDSNLRMRVNESGSANTSSNYDNTGQFLRSGNAESNLGNSNQSYFGFGSYIGADAGETVNGVTYIFKANDSAEHTSITTERAQVASSGELTGEQGGGYLTVNSAIDGVTFFISSGNIESGTFTLYGLKK